MFRRNMKPISSIINKISKIVEESKYLRSNKRNERKKGTYTIENNQKINFTVTNKIISGKPVCLQIIMIMQLNFTAFRRNCMDNEVWDQKQHTELITLPELSCHTTH